MATIDRELSQTLVLFNTLIGETELQLDAYGSVEEANIYFDNRLHSNGWKNASITDKKLALVQATRQIDLLPFSGDKTDEAQVKEFPRDGSEVVPRKIEMATYEIALKLLEGFNIEAEIRNLSATTNSYGGVRSTYDRSFVPDYLRAGIPSAQAWALLVPYMSDPRSFTLSRVS